MRIKNGSIFALILLTTVLLTACGRGRDTEIEVSVALTQTAVALDEQDASQVEGTAMPVVVTPTPSEAGAVAEEQATGSTDDSGSIVSGGGPTAPLFFIDAATKQIVRLDTDGVSQTTLTDEDSAVLDFDVAPDGSRLAYVVANQLVELDLTSSTRTVKVQGETISFDDIQDRFERRIHSLHYSPDGSQIAFGLGGVNLIKSGTNNDIDLLLPSSAYPTANSPAANGDDPIRFFWPLGWSPDSGKLLVEFAYYPESGGLAIYDLASSQLVDFTSDDPNIAVCCEAAWSPDSNRLYLASNLLVFGNPGLSVVDTNTGAATLLVQGLPDETNSDFNFFRAPFGAEDGVLVFLNRTADLSRILDYALTGIGENGVAMATQQDDKIELEGEATWVADGSGIAYLSDLIIEGLETTGNLTWWPLGGAPIGFAAEGHMLRFPSAGLAEIPSITIVDEEPQTPIEDERSNQLSAFVAEQWNIDLDVAANSPAIDGIFSFPLRTPSDTLPLWVSHTTGLRNFDENQYHVVGIFTPDGDRWRELTRLELGEATDPVNAAPIPDFLGEGGVSQVNIEPSHQWLSVEGGAGAHSGIFNLLSYDQEILRLEASGFSASPGVARFADLSSDGNQEAILDVSDYYVFCYACGVQLPQYDLLRWNGTRMEGVSLQPLRADAPPALAEINKQALTLVEGGLWKDALSAIEEGRALAIDDPIFEWNGTLIELNANAKREVAADENGYPILDNVFYGDYDSAVDIMRDYGPADIFTSDSPLILDTPAEGNNELLSDWITRTTASALNVLPDLASAHYLRGWAAYLESEDIEIALPTVAQAAALEPDDELYRDSIAYLLGDEIAAPAEPTAVTESPATTVTSPISETVSISEALPVNNTLRTLTLVNVRLGPSTAAEVLGTLAEGDIAEVIGKREDGLDPWWQIIYPPDSEEMGWVSGDPTLVIVNAPDAPLVDVEESLSESASSTTSNARIFFSAQNDEGNDAIFQLLEDGTTIEIVENAKQPAIQPGGERLAFYSTRSDMLGLGGYDLSSDERLRFAFSIEDGLPTWDPNVQRIIFSSTRYGDGRSRLYAVWADGQGDVVDLGDGQDPSWHPDQGLVAFKGCDISGAQCGLWTMRADGTDRRRLTDNANDARPVWTPDGSALIFMNNDRDGNWELYRLDVDSGTITRLTNNPANDGLPAVSPDGSQIAFMSNRDGAWTLQVMPINGGPAQTLYTVGDNVADWLSQGIAWER